MIQLLIIADDFTGALDTGVQLAKRGAATKVVTRITDEPLLDEIVRDFEVLVIDSETRHLERNEAFEVIREISNSIKKYDIPIIYKKTDSALRGNIGAELESVMESLGEKRLAFLPAYPEIGRVTKKGTQYIDGIPVAESVFGSDPFNPVNHSWIPDIIGDQTKEQVIVCGKELRIPAEEGITVYDADNAEEMAEMCRKLVVDGVRLFAGCASAAGAIASLMNFSGDGAKESVLADGMTVICGSINPVSVEQLDTAQNAGFVRYRLSPQQKLDDEWMIQYGDELILNIKKLIASNEYVMIDTNDENGNLDTREYADRSGMDIEEVRRAISATLGRIFCEIFDDDNLGTILITGGDTLKECMDSTGVYQFEPISEMFPGVVLSRFSHHGKARYVLTKSGGFGDKDLLIKLADMIKKQRESED